MSTLELRLFDEAIRPKNTYVNVASVPNRSPWRYPGGKTWLVPRIRQWLTAIAPKPTRLIEPFAGGGTVSLTAAFEGLTVCGATMIELDTEVAATWSLILNGQAEWLAKRIVEFELSKEAVEAELMKKSPSLADIGFSTLLRNRINHGGILAPGSGKLKNGEHGKGIGSRWYPNTLSRRILDIARVANRLDFINADGLEYIESYGDHSEVVWFIDPPYTAGKSGKRAGTRLYTHFQLDHERLFAASSKLAGDFLMTYDNDPFVVGLAKAWGLDTEVISMKGTHLSAREELLIGRDLGWARS